MIKVCECGCKTQTREITTSYVLDIYGSHELKKITNTCDGCGKSMLSVMDKGWNKRQFQKLQEVCLSKINVND